MPTRSPDFFGILEVLVEEEVEFIVVGGVCATIHGAPVTTFDLDIVHRRSEENIARMSRALQRLDAIYREQPERRLRPSASHLTGPGHQLLLSRLGPIDVLGAIGDSEDYDALLPHTDTVQVRDMTLRILSLAKLISVKEHAGRDKDTLHVAILKRTLDEME